MAETNLIKKTKAQLVDIILRKDAVEQECRKEIESLNKRIKSYDKDIESMVNKSKENHANLLHQEEIIETQSKLIDEKDKHVTSLEETLDDLTSEYEALIHDHKKITNTLSIINLVLLIGFVCALVF